MESVVAGGPLDGVRVVSMAMTFPGPFAAALLSDLGADVIKVENPQGGDLVRARPRQFDALNRGTRSVALDMKGTAGQAAVHRLVANADAFVEGYRPGVADRLGVGYDRLRDINPRLVYVSISGYGQTGPWREKAGHDLGFQALSGLLEGAVKARQTGAAPETTWADLFTGLYSAVAILAGLVQVGRRGQGGYYDVAMADSMLAAMGPLLLSALDHMPTEPQLETLGYGTFLTADERLLTLSVIFEDHFWQRLCAVAGLDDLAGLTDAQRSQASPEQYARVRAAIASRTLSEWAGLLDRGDVPWTPVLTLAEAVQHPQPLERGMFVTVPADGERPARRYVRQPIVFDGHGGGPRRHAPRLGEHNAELLGQPPDETR